MVTGEEADDADLDAPKVYEPISSLDALADKLNSYMEQYNETVRGGKMDMVFFKVNQGNYLSCCRCRFRLFTNSSDSSYLPVFITE